MTTKKLIMMRFLMTMNRHTVEQKGPTEGACSMAAPAMSTRPRTSALRMPSTHSTLGNVNHR